MVRTHLRTRAAQAGALLAVIVGGVLATPAVAMADVTVQITNLAGEVVSGGTVTLRYTIANTDDGQGGNAPANVTVETGGLNCSGECGGIAPADGQPLEARLTAPNVEAGQTREFRVTVTATVGRQTGTSSGTVRVKGPDKPSNVRQVSGRVKDQNGKSISGATVAMQDSANNQYRTTTNGSGAYSFTASESKPIAPGSISVGALKDGYQQATARVQGAAGRTVNVPLTLKEIAASASASPSASASASASAEPTEEVSAEPTVEDTVQTENTAPDTKKTSGEDGGGSMLYIVLGALLVAAGVGAFVLLWMRRKNNDDEDGGDDPTKLAGAGGVVPPSQGRYNDATRVGAPVGPANDATMIAPRSGAPSISDAPTMLQRPVVEDEFPDPYGAPIPPQGGYAGASAGGWEDNYGGGYNEAAPYGQQPDDGYGAQQQYAGAGYGNQPAPQQRYDDPTGMYRPEDDDQAGYGGYDQGGYGNQGGAQQYGGQQYGGGNTYNESTTFQPGGYQADPGTYGGQQYGQPDNGNAYGAPDNGYGAQQQYGGGNAYGQPGGGYDEPDEYGNYGQQQPPQQQQQYGQQQPGGYDDPDGYDQRGGTYGGTYGGSYGGQSRR